MKDMRKLIALLLVVFMLVGTLPMSIFAADGASAQAAALSGDEVKARFSGLKAAAAAPTDDGPILIVAASDFQDPKTSYSYWDRSGSYNNQNNRLTSISEKIKSHYSGIDAYAFFAGGDYGFDSDLDTTKTNTGIAQVKNTIEAKFPNLQQEIFVQGNHDNTTGNWTGSGAYDTDYYGVFAISEDDFPAETGVPKAATLTALDTYLAGRTTSHPDQPVFILTHVPMHFDLRTVAKGDGMYGIRLFNVISKYGNDLDIIFLYGHNHAHCDDDYIGGSSNFYTVGDKIKVAEDGSRSEFTEETLNFTYMNYGYTGYYWKKWYTSGTPQGGNADNTLTMTSFLIDDGKVEIRRWDEGDSTDTVYGEHVLKAKGALSIGDHVNTTGNWNSDLGYDDTVVNSPVTITLKGGSSSGGDDSGESGDPVVTDPVTQTDTATGISVTAKGITALSVGTGDTTATYDGITQYAAYDITLTGYVQGDEATVSIPVPAGYDPDYVRIYHRANGKIESVLSHVENGKAVFTTDHFSEYLIAEIDSSVAGSWFHVYVEEQSETHYSYELDTDGIDSGDQYLIVGSDNSNAMGHLKNSQSVTISNNSIDLTTKDYEWTITSNGTQTNEESVSVAYSDRNNSTYTNGDYYYEGKEVTQLSCDRKWDNKKKIYTYTWTVNGETASNDSSLSLTKRSTVDVYTIYNGSQYLTVSSNALAASDTASDWTISNNNGSYTVKNGNYYLRYNNGFGVTNQNYTNTVRLFKFDETNEVVTDEGKDYWRRMTGVSEGDVIKVKAGSYENQTALETELKNIIKVQKANDELGTEAENVTYKLTAGRSYRTDEATQSDVEYTVSYDGKTVGTFKIRVYETQIESIAFKSDADKEGSVIRNPKSNAKLGSYITVSYDDGTTEDVEITADMLSGDGLDLKTVGDYSGLTVTYGGKTLSGFTLHVIPNPAENDFPEYPEGGSVKVGKTGSGIDFQSTGVAKIELSAAGVSMNKGIDVIVMIDTSSSMNSNKVIGTNVTRMQVMKESLATLISDLQYNEDGTPADIQIAVGDFNGYTQIDSSDKLWSSVQSAEQKGKQFTGDGSYGAGAFVQASTITDPTAFANQLTYYSGTNYDYAFDTIYRLASAKKAANTEARDLVVVFMTDGASFQYNYYMTYSEYTLGNDYWNGWLNGEFNTGSSANTYFNNSTHKYFANFGTVDDNGTTVNVHKHRMAEAIKGDPDTTYKVISPNSTIPNSSAVSGESYMYNVPGLGATMYTIGFCLYDDKAAGKRDEATQGALYSDMVHNVKYLASTDEDGNYLYFPADTKDDLNDAFDNISRSIRYAATNAYFTDKMGSAFDLTLDPIRYVNNDAPDGAPQTCIEVKNYELDPDSGKRVGTGTLLEKVYKDGDNIKSDKLTDTTILNSDGVICAKTFYYNTASSAKTVDGIEIPAESFYWKVGTINDNELVLSYYVYLTGALEGEAEAGSYDTNESAVLYYDNWLEHFVNQPTVSPTMPWGAANVSYGFYLVDENGVPVVNQTTGQTGSFERSVKVTNPVLYKTINLNSGSDVNAEIVATDALPKYYTLYDEDAAYSVTVDSDGGGSWTVTGTEMTDTTYVTGYNGNESTTTKTSTNESGYSYANTTVWFAVKFIVKCYPDTVVIDYGLPVDIDVLDNDMFGTNGVVVGIGEVTAIPDGNKTAELAAGFGKTFDNNYGTSAVNGLKIRYTPFKNIMEMTGPDEFAYAVQVTAANSDVNGYYYGTVTVVPATTIYYEDDFVTYTGPWSTEGTTISGATQHEDRPGFYSLPEIDANNVYGYDSTYDECTTYSLGSAHKVTVSSNMTEWPTAAFMFTGTGFDVISVTSKDTGYVMVEVKNHESGKVVARWSVDTYYGYDLAGNGDLTPADNGTLYQIPVLKSAGSLEYGTYEVTITPMYYEFFEHKAGGSSYDFYLDAIRIYDPADGNPNVLGYYGEDKEAYPVYKEVRDILIDQGDFGNENVKGTFVDNYGADNATIKVFKEYGPNNEVYLDENQAIVFNITSTDASNIASVQIGAKSVEHADSTAADIVKFTINGKEFKLNTASDMYYNITDLIKWNGNTSGDITIENTDGNIVSLTNIKITYKSAPASSGENN